MTRGPGAPFYLMERRRGIILRKPPPADRPMPPEAVRRLCESLIDGLARLHSLDYEAAGLGDLGKPEGLRRAPGDGLDPTVSRRADRRPPQPGPGRRMARGQPAGRVRGRARSTTTTSSTTSCSTPATRAGSSPSSTGRWPRSATRSWTWGRPSATGSSRPTPSRSGGSWPVRRRCPAA